MKLLRKKNYLAMIENAAKGENRMFRNLYAEIDPEKAKALGASGKEVDILEDGGLSCGFFVSSVLYLNKLIGGLHATVRGTEADMLSSGWIEVKDLKSGAVLIWEKQNGHAHIGFYAGEDLAISNDSRGKGFPHKHHYTYNDIRKIEKIYWNANLDD